MSSSFLAFTGDEPFGSRNLVDLANYAGAEKAVLFDDLPREDGEIPWGDIDLVVVGRKDFAVGELKASLASKEGITYLSQEAFLDYLLFGTRREYEFDDERIQEHPGLKYLVDTQGASS